MMPGLSQRPLIVSGRRRHFSAVLASVPDILDKPRL